MYSSSNYLLYASCILIFLIAHCRLATASSHSSTCDAGAPHTCKHDTPRHIAMIGNPGTGKSTLLNGLAGKPVFDAGFSLGGGLTKDMSSFSLSKLTLYDTPGLNDVIHRMEAARQIQRLLDISEDIRLVFVMTLQAGRIRVEDVTTMHIVLDALSRPSSKSLVDKYAIILNKLSTVELDYLKSAEGRKMKRSITGKNRRTSHWAYILTDSALIDADNATMNIPNDAYKVIMNAPVTKRKHIRAGKIDARGFEERLDEERARMKKEESKLRADIDMHLDELKKIFGGRFNESIDKAVEYLEVRIGLLVKLTSYKPKNKWKFNFVLISVVIALSYPAYLILRLLHEIPQALSRRFKQLFGTDTDALENYDRVVGDAHEDQWDSDDEGEDDEYKDGDEYKGEYEYKDEGQYEYAEGEGDDIEIELLSDLPKRPKIKSFSPIIHDPTQEGNENNDWRSPQNAGPVNVNPSANGGSQEDTSNYEFNWYEPRDWDISLKQRPIQLRSERPSQPANEAPVTTEQKAQTQRPVGRPKSKWNKADEKTWTKWMNEDRTRAVYLWYEHKFPKSKTIGSADKFFLDNISKWKKLSDEERKVLVEVIDKWIKQDKEDEARVLKKKRAAENNGNNNLEREPKRPKTPESE